jgi:hypothetical protein
MPSFGLKRTSRASLRQTTAAIWALSSFSEKYQWPELASLRFEISPSTQTSKSSVSRIPWMRSVSSETLSARRGSGLLGAAGGRAVRAFGASWSLALSSAGRAPRAGSACSLGSPPKSKPFWFIS